MSIAMPTGVYVGLATTSGRTDRQETATFDNAYETPSGRRTSW